MELVPIIYKILVISGALLSLVLFLSYISSKISNRSKGNDRSDRKLGGTRFTSNQMNYFDSRNGKFAGGMTNSFAEKVNNTGTNVKGVRVIRSSYQQTNKAIDYRYSKERLEKWKKSRPRFSVLNESLKPQKVYSQQDNEFRIFYHKNYSNIA